MLGGAQWWSRSLQVLIEVVLFSLGALVAEVVLCSSFSVWSRLMPAPSDFAKQQVSILQRILSQIRNIRKIQNKIPGNKTEMKRMHLTYHHTEYLPKFFF